MTAEANWRARMSPVRELRASAAVLLVALVSACGSAVSHLNTSLQPHEFAYAVIAANSVRPEDMARALVERGYTVVTGIGSEQLTALELPARTLLLLSCVYLGQSGNDLTGTSANVSCAASDASTKEAIYSATGKHMGMSIDDDIRGAISRALRDLPTMNRPGGVAQFSTIASLSAREAKPAASNRLPQIASTGTGFYVGSRGHLLSNAHVVRQCSSIRVRGIETGLQLVTLDTVNDIAVLLANRPPVASARFRQGRAPRAGDAVVALGFPLSGILASEANVSTGTISALAGMRDDYRFLQITAPVQPGNSGGPLLDANGNVIGIVTAKLDALRVARLTGDVPQNVNFALNASIARLLLDAIGVEYTTSFTDTVMSAADLADMAKAYVVPIECWR